VFVGDTGQNYQVLALYLAVGFVVGTRTICTTTQHVFLAGELVRQHNFEPYASSQKIQTIE
jgi:hypothetical protein